MQGEVGRERTVETPQELQEFLMSMTPVALADDLAGQHVQRGEQRRRAVALVVMGASCEKRVRPSFCLRPRGERGSADGTQRSQDDSDRHCGRGAGAAGVHGACLPVMRASTREEMRRISSTSRSSSRLFSIHSR